MFHSPKHRRPTSNSPHHASDARSRCREKKRVFASLRASLLAGVISLFSLDAAQGETPPQRSPFFSNPPLQYNADNSALYRLPPTVDVPAGHAADGQVPGGPALRLSQRTVNTPTPLPQDDPFGPYDFIPPPSDGDEFDNYVAGPKLSSFKSGFFQKLSFTETWLDRGKPTDYGVNEVELFMTVAVPAPSKEWPLLITPYMNMRLLDGPKSPDLPAQLYETYVDMMWVPRFSERLIGILAVAPSVYSDFKADGFRMTGKALIRYDIVPDRLQLLAGVLYLNRNDIRTLPAGGLIWTPNPDIRYEAVFPRPKFAHRFAYGDEWEDWIYLAGEFGGNSFAIQRAPGVDDTVTLRDWRAMMGVERKLNGGAGFRLEIGYVFSRTIEFASGNPPDTQPSPTVLVRAGIVF